MLPETIGQYRLIDKLGEGGMGVVYRAADETNRRHVALKLLRSEWASDPQAVERLQREAHITLALNHPNICTAYEFGEFASCPYIVMELLDGQTLNDMLDGWPLALDRALDIGIQVADAMDAAHNRGVIHRDLKPSNIFITDKGIKVLDFGLAKLGQTAPAELASVLGQNSSTSAGGLTVGTETNMSPEQVAGEALDHRSDIFSLGIVLYEMATGVLPFRGIDAPMIMKAILCESHPPASKLNPNLPKELDEIIDRVLNKAADSRYQNMAELKAELVRLRSHLGTTAAPPVVAPPAPSEPPKPAEPPTSSAIQRPAVAHLEDAFTAAQIAVGENFAAVDRATRDFIEQGTGTLYCFGVPLGGIAYPGGFRHRLEPALESPRIDHVRLIIDSAEIATPQLFRQQVLPLVQSWARRKRRVLSTAAEEHRGRVFDPTTQRTVLSWIYVDLSVELIPSFRIFIRDGVVSTGSAAGAAEVILTAQLCNVRVKDGSLQNLRLAETVFCVRGGADMPLLATFGRIAQRWDCLFP